MPTCGGGRAQPIAVGNRIFHCADWSNLNCYDADTGKLLWIRSFDYYRVMLASWQTAEVKPAPEIIAQVEDAVNAIDAKNSEIVALANSRKSTFIAVRERDALDAVLHALMQRFDPKRKMLTNTTWEKVRTGWVLTPCSDGKAVYVFGQNSVAAAYDFDGNPLWLTDIDHPDGSKYGFAGSPVLIDGQFIVQQNRITAFNAKTGTVAWTADGRLNRASAIMLHAADGTPLYVTNSGQVLRAADGKPYASGSPQAYGMGGQNIASPTRIDDHTIGVLGNGGFTICYPADEAVSTKLIPNVGGLITSPLVTQGLLFTYHHDGDLSAFDIESTKLLWRRQVGANVRQQNHGQPSITSSPISAGKYLYLFDDSATCAVVEIGREAKVCLLYTSPSPRD